MMTTPWGVPRGDRRVREPGVHASSCGALVNIPVALVQGIIPSCDGFRDLYSALWTHKSRAAATRARVLEARSSASVRARELRGPDRRRGARTGGAAGSGSEFVSTPRDAAAAGPVRRRARQSRAHVRRQRRAPNWNAVMGRPAAAGALLVRASTCPSRSRASCSSTPTCSPTPTTTTPTRCEGALVERAAGVGRLGAGGAGALQVRRAAPPAGDERPLPARLAVRRLAAGRDAPARPAARDLPRGAASPRCSPVTSTCTSAPTSAGRDGRGFWHITTGRRRLAALPDLRGGAGSRAGA